MTIKAAVVGHGMVLSNVATKVVDPVQIDEPTFSLNCIDELVITCSNSGVPIYYTMTSGDGTQADPEDPDPATNVGTLYEEPLTLNTGDKVKAIACVSGTLCSDVSDVYLYNPTIPHTEEPTIERTALNEVTITCPDGKIYYTTNGEDPVVSGPGDDSPVTISYDGTGVVEVRALAKAEGMEASCISRRFMVPQPTSVTVTDEGCTETSPQCNKLAVTLPEGVTNAMYAVTAGNGSAAPSLDAVPNPYVPYTEGINLDYLDGSNEYYTVHVYAFKESDHSYQAVSVSHQMKTSGKPVLTPPVGSSPIVGISGGVFGNVAVCTIDMGTPATGDDIVTEVPIASDGTAQYIIPGNASGTLTVTFQHGVWQPSCGATYTLPDAPATPTWSQSCDNKLSLHTESTMAVIHYTIDGTEPLLSSLTYTEGCLYNIPNGTRVRAKAFQGFLCSGELDYIYEPIHVEVPQFFVDGTTVTISGPTGATVYYTKSVGTQPGVVPADPVDPDPADPTNIYNPTQPITIAGNNIITVFKAIAIPSDPEQASCVRRVVTREGYSISSASDLNKLSLHTSSYFFVLSDVDATGFTGTVNKFTGVLDGNYYVISNLSVPLFDTISGSDDHNAAVLNVMLKNVTINTNGNAGAIANTAKGYTRIYNCGILPDNPDGTTTSSIRGARYVGGLVGELAGTARVINCFSYANITGGSTVAGLVGYCNNTDRISQSNYASRCMVVNCMFYGDITGGTTRYPVYGGLPIQNEFEDGVNPYCYFRKNAGFDNDYTSIENYNRSWPAEEKNLTRFEYYRSVLNSNRRLCTWWINGTQGIAPTDAEIETLGIAKWVLDPSIAPYPILKSWDYYPSVINIDEERVWDPRTLDADGNTITPHWVNRFVANEWEGKSYGTLSVTIQAGSNNSSAPDVIRNITITDMDTLNCDYGYYKIQLPYYNEVFGNPNATTHVAKYAHNYTDKVVTGWMIKTVTGGTPGTFANFNFADRDCTNKDLFSVSGRVFAQGGYYYVPNGVSAITIEAYWGDAVYLANRGYSVDRVMLTIPRTNDNDKPFKQDKPFVPAGSVPAGPEHTFHGQTVYNDLQLAIKALGTISDYPTVYDQAIVLINNHQVENGSNLYPTTSNPTAPETRVGWHLDNNWHPFTIMSADLDFDCEPDNCLELQFRYDIDRPGIQPIRFDFLPVVELGLAVRHDNRAYAIGIMVPEGHFEVTETAFMRTTQFEFDGYTPSGNDGKRVSGLSPMIINGGEYEMFNFRYHDANRTSYFIVGGKAWVHRFAPGCHPHTAANASITFFPVNVIGGECPEFYLSGLYKPGITTNSGSPVCYTNGGKFGIMAGAGYDKVPGGVTFKINHSLINEFYGGGINAANPIGGNIDVTIDYSHVHKYCGGPMVGDMTGKTVTTHATGTIFGVFYGGGNGGNAYYRDLQHDGDMPSTHIGTWTDNGYNWNLFNPLGSNQYDAAKGYHAEYEFEVFNQSNGVVDNITQRGFYHWVNFGTTKTGNVYNTLVNCTINGNFYGGGNFGGVNGSIISTLTDTRVFGSVYGAGYSGKIPTFTVHDKSTVSFPSIDWSGTITDGFIGNRQENGVDIEFTWSHTLGSTADPITPPGQGSSTWYCYTQESLENLGAVTGNIDLTIKGSSTIGRLGTITTGNVFGGGNESNVTGGTIVKILGHTVVYGNVYGGGNMGTIGASTKVIINGQYVDGE